MTGAGRAILLLTGVFWGCGSLPPEIDTPGGSGRHHPVGFALAQQHAPALKSQAEDCRFCHGGDLAGGSVGVSCDGCHPAGWRTNCVFCHGGVDNTLGSPPRDLSGETTPSLLSFPAHTAHVAERSHRPYDCTQCHTKPIDVLSPGHVFDETPGRAEVDFQAGLSAQGTYDGATCSSLYCHGNGRGANGTYARAGPATTCRSCHPDRNSGSAAWGTMSRGHDSHLGQGTPCYECHGGVVNTAGNAILDPARHVDGMVDVSFPTSNIVYTAGRCSGTCHNEGHTNERW